MALSPPLELGEISAYQDVAIQAFTVNGKIYGVPYATENIALVRNTTFVKDAPKTFDDMIEMGKKSGAKYPFLVGLDPKQSDPYHLYHSRPPSGPQSLSSRTKDSIPARSPWEVPTARNLPPG